MTEHEGSEVHIEDREHESDSGFDPAALASAAADAIGEQARAHPYRTIAAAFGLGYVLGGGVPKFVVRLAGMALVRAAGTAVLNSGTAHDLVDRAMGGLGRREGNGHSRRYQS
jgi:hypothetical protein